MLAAVITTACTVFLAALAVAWRLGGLERTVKDTQSDVQEAKGQIRDLTNDVRRIEQRQQRR